MFIIQEEKNKWVKYGALFAIAIMVGSAVLVGILGSWDKITGDKDGLTEHSFSDISGKHMNFTFKNAKDAAKILPENILAINIVKIYADDSYYQSIQSSFPGANISKMLSASYADGGLELFVIEDESNAGIVLNTSKPQIETYENYSLIFINPYQKVVVGNPILISTVYDYTAGNTLAKKTIDVLSGKSEGSTGLNDILAYADDVSNYDEIVVFKANTGSSYEKYYQRSSQSVNMTSFQIDLQFESILLNPSDEMKQDLSDLSQNASDGIQFTITEESNIMKIYVEGADYTGFLNDTNALYKIVSNHTKQAATA